MLKARPIRQLTREGELVKEHKSVYAAAKELGGNTTAIRKAAAGEMPTAYNYRWEYIEQGGSNE